MLSISQRWGLGLVLGASAAAASAAEGDWLTIEGDYLIGASVVSGNGHIGDAPVRYDFKPMWAFQLGPFRVSRSRAASLMQAGRENARNRRERRFRYLRPRFGSSERNLARKEADL